MATSRIPGDAAVEVADLKSDWMCILMDTTQSMTHDDRQTAPQDAGSVCSAGRDCPRFLQGTSSASNLSGDSLMRSATLAMCCQPELHIIQVWSQRFLCRLRPSARGPGDISTACLTGSCKALPPGEPEPPSVRAYLTGPVLLSACLMPVAAGSNGSAFRVCAPGAILGMLAGTDAELAGFSTVKLAR